MSSINQEYSRRIKEEKVARRAKLESMKGEKKAPVVEEETILVRARDESGHFIADNPDTVENEAWVEKIKSKITKKKSNKKAKKK